MSDYILTGLQALVMSGVVSITALTIMLIVSHLYALSF